MTKADPSRALIKARLLFVKAHAATVAAEVRASAWDDQASTARITKANFDFVRSLDALRAAQEEAFGAPVEAVEA